MPINITLGIVARNEEQNIGSTLKSIVAQEFNHSYEILVVDGNSTDKTREIAENVLKSSGMPYKVLNEVDFGFHGLCFARNLVLDKSNPESHYIAFTDADCIVDKKWLQNLYDALEGTDEYIAGAGGPRLIAETGNKKELVINAFLTSFLASGGNPAFSKRKVEFIESIPNYNAIYKREIISKFRYDNELIISDDNELNFRLKKAGYKFRYVPDASVWHRETDSIRDFAANMFSYGVNISNTVRKHRSMVRINVPVTVAFIIYLILVAPLYLWIGYWALIPLILYVIFAVSVFIEIILKTKTIYSLMAFLLLPVQHVTYGLGVLYNLIMNPHKKK
ncbi:glycosyltransferase [Methanobacterium aggregans]|uniref:glycosyltransferase n=2 Tax=Methanobacterium aggregans TaxID=1615586 RepID=UPI001AEA013C|nr:glycosyltransferase [Methanobacterium aggregans]MBP2045062.1 glycosyltransferase involved in cell wall biosynthesis [Methanobacterium aggregans]